MQAFPGLRCNLQGKGGNFEMLTMARGLCFYLCEYLEAQVKNTGLTTHTQKSQHCQGPELPLMDSLGT